MHTSLLHHYDMLSGIFRTSTVSADDTRYIPAALPASEVIYFLATQDSQDRTLDASTGYTYTLTFNLPVPASAFWSLTMYNATTQFLINNPINRYDIGDRVSFLSTLCDKLRRKRRLLSGLRQFL